MRKLYPASKPLSSEQLEVGGGHTIHVEQAGSAGGIPVVFLHGGPGSGCKPDHHQFFDPDRYRVVLIDQRGAGRSRPYGGVENNTTDLLIDDLEAVRQHFGIEAWLLFGGSWGATLALAYAQRCPQRVLAMILRGTFLARLTDVEWFFGQGANRLLPRQWQYFLDSVGPLPASGLADTLHRAIFSADEAEVHRVAAAWEAWSGAVVMFSIDQAGSGTSTSGSTDSAAATRNCASESAISKARIEMHYAHHRYFLAENQLLEEASALPRVPIHIIHGARDLTCPAEAAWRLHRAVPHSTLEILRSAGHLSSETPMVDALVRATDAMAKKLA